MTIQSGSRNAAAPCLLILTFVLSAPLLAQEKAKDAKPADDTLTEVVVTGSRIARPDLDRLEPTISISSQTFDQRGFFDVGAALSENPAFGVQPSSAANQQGAFGIAQSFVDLYSLGSQRTLVLVDGRRFVAGNTASLNGQGGNTSLGGPGQQVDLNTIPTKLIDRVETISVGGAPIYGADAIAGTVNVILKHDFQGFDLDAQGGLSNLGDAGNYRLRALAGQNFADGRANVTAVAEFTKSDGLIGTQRSVYAQDLGFLAPATPGPYAQVLTPAQTVAGINYGGIPMVDDAVVYSPTGVGLPAPPGGSYGITNAAGQLLAWNHGSALQPYNLGTPTGNPVFSSGGDGERLSQTSNLLSPTERMNLDVLGNFALNDHMKAFAEGWFSETHATALLQQPAYNTFLFGSGGTANGNFILNVNNPFLQPGDRQLIQTALANYSAALGGTGFIYPGWNPNQFYVARANIDLQGGRATDTQVLSRGVLGLKGDFSIFERDFNWEVAANYGEVSSTSLQPSYVFQNVQNALNATTNAAGQIVCAGTPVAANTSTASSTCAPLNIFGVGSPSQAALQYITHVATATSYNTQRDVTAHIGGDLYKLPGGEIKLDLGFENRREAAIFSPDTFYTETLGQSSVTGIEGSYRTNEVSAETLIPIVSPENDLPLLHRVELEGAARRVDNSIAGAATTWTEGMRFEPTQDVQLRANRTKSIRAPAITELFLPAATSFQFANDPCDKNYVGQGLDPAVRAKNCAAAGINTSTFTSNVVNATAKGITSGNPALSSESADSRTYGIVLRPRWVPRLNLSVDYVDIKLSNAIESLTLVQILDACYDSTDYPSNTYCKQFTRNAQGQITNFTAGYVNAGLLDFKGIQTGVDWSTPLPLDWGNVAGRISYLDTRQLVSVIGSAAPVIYNGQLGTPTSKGSVDLLYSKDKFSWDWLGIFIGSSNFNNQNTAASQNILGVAPWWVINSTLGLDLDHNVKVRLIVDNVFDKQPPFPALVNSGGNFANATSQYFSGIIGRTFLLSAGVKF